MFKNFLKIFTSKIFALTYVSLILIGLLWWYVGKYVYRTQAASPAVNIVIAPKSDTLSTTQPTYINIIMQPAVSGKKISAFDLNFTLSGKAKIVGMVQPTNLATGQHFGQLVGTPVITAQQARIVYVSQDQDANLPNAVKLQVKIQATEVAGTATLHVDATKTQIAGNIPERSYSLGVVDEGTYTTGGGSACGRCSRTIPGQYVTWIEFDGTCDRVPATPSNISNEVRNNNDSRCQTPTITPQPATQVSCARCSNTVPGKWVKWQEKDGSCNRSPATASNIINEQSFLNNSHCIATSQSGSCHRCSDTIANQYVSWNESDGNCDRAPANKVSNTQRYDNDYRCK